jgi:hypothetical protein
MFIRAPSSGGGQEEPHPEGEQENQDGAHYEEYLHGLILHGRATASIHFAIPPACSETRTVGAADADACMHPGMTIPGSGLSLNRRSAVSSAPRTLRDNSSLPHSGRRRTR